MPGLKPGPLTIPPPSSQEWKARGEKGEPPLPYEKVIRSAPNNGALEYLIYHAFISEITPRALERRIHQLEEARSRKNERYNRAGIYYLKLKLQELVVGDA